MNKSKNSIFITIIIILLILLVASIIIIFKSNNIEQEEVSAGLTNEITINEESNIVTENTLIEKEEITSSKTEAPVSSELTNSERKEIEEYVDLICNSPKYSMLVEFENINEADKDWIYSHIDQSQYKTYITEKQILNELRKIFSDKLEVNIKEDQKLISQNSATNIPKFVEDNKYFLTPYGDTLNVIYVIDSIKKNKQEYIVDVVEYGVDIDNENSFEDNLAIYSYKENEWNKTFNLEENQTGKESYIIDSILKSKSNYNMYQIIILQENNGLFVNKIKKK